MNIEQIKVAIGAKLGISLPCLDLAGQLDETTNLVDTTWLSHWVEDGRVRITMHEEVYSKIKADKTFSGLAIKPMEVIPERIADPATEVTYRAAYRKFMVITPKSIVDTI